MTAVINYLLLIELYICNFPNRVCRNLNNTNEHMIKDPLSVLNKERSHGTHGKGQLVQS